MNADFINFLSALLAFMFLEDNMVSFLQLKIGYEFDFVREANAMERIQRFLYENNKKAPVLVPRVIRDMATRYSILHSVFYWLNLKF